MEEAPKRILVIDDDPLIQAAFEIVFKNAGFGYTRAQSAAEGLCELATAGFDLVIIDGLLPDKSGAALCERIRSLPRYKDLKTIYYSAFFKKAEGLKGLEAGVAADLALQKPVNPEKLLHHAVELLGGRRGVVAQLYGAPFNELRNEFNGEFHNRLRGIESLIDTLAAGGPREPNLKKLLFAAHKLHGESAIFGQPLVGEAAAIWEEELDAIVETGSHVTPRIIGKFRFYFDWLKLNFQTPAQVEMQEIEILELEVARQAAPEAAPVMEDAAEAAPEQDEAEPDDLEVAREQEQEIEPEEEPALDAGLVSDAEGEHEMAAASEDAVAGGDVSEEDDVTEDVSAPEDEAAIDLAEEAFPHDEQSIEAEISPEDAEGAPVEEDDESAPQDEPAPVEAPVAEEPKSEEEVESSAFVDEVLLTLASAEQQKRELEQPLGVLEEEDIFESIEALTAPAVSETSKTGEYKDAATEKPSAEFGGPDILIVDDDPVVQRLVSYALGLRGFSHETIGDGDTARIRLFEKGYPPLPRIILLDVDLPGTDGFTLLREIKETAETRAIKVIMVSAHGREEDLLRGFECGATDFIIKPFSVPILAHKIRIAMASFCDLRVGG